MSARRFSRRRLAGLGLSLTLALLPLAARAALDEALEKQLARLVQLGQQRPEAALAELNRLRDAPQAQQPRLDFAEARIRMLGGDDAAALKLAESLAARPDMAAQAALVRAGIAERQGQSSEVAALAQLALDRLNEQCTPGDEAASLKRGCDFRSAWLALHMLQQDQLLRGALPQALAQATRALALAQVGQDLNASLQSMGAIAQILQAQDLLPEARQWLARARQLAEGDALLMAQAKTFEAVVAGRSGDKPGQFRAQMEGLELARQAGADRLVARAQNNLADYYMHQGEPARALALAREALPVFLRLKDQSFERLLRHNMSVALVRLKQFDAARREIARVEELRRGQADTTSRIRQLRELGEAWAEAGQPREAIALFHLERELTAEANARNREASLRELEQKYDSSRKQRDLDLLTRDKTIKDQQLGNRRLAQQVGIAVALLLGMSLLLAAVMVRKVRAANKRLKAKQAQLRLQSERDPLTELANRRHFLAVMEQQPQAQFSGALLMIDIDHFKHVNDEHGHAVGDVVICEVARRLSHAVRSEDLVVRWGGEEFLVFAPDVSQHQLVLLAERILLNVGSLPVETEDGPLRVTVSIGFAHFPLPPMHLSVHWEQAVNWADMALYTAKAQGRNRAMGIATVDARDTDALLQIEADFEAACSSERVSLRQVLGPPPLTTAAAASAKPSTADIA
ncbi:diguanylate cyclase [Roseateles violae]|uniref:diguanylate cyclase n=1 Tax=Roseateles violae TaxID=3058042 RepID=A0ABT8DPM3_9BURK|nr:diguanylate cyclase [Pelomonas sp. PFR6]MDN3918990.1 diguanylate cyclase [Pelomonas sp. PFR6]